MLPTDDFDLCPLQDVTSLPRTRSVDDVVTRCKLPRLCTFHQNILT